MPNEIPVRDLGGDDEPIEYPELDQLDLITEMELVPYVEPKVLEEYFLIADFPDVVLIQHLEPEVLNSEGLTWEEYVSPFQKRFDNANSRDTSLLPKDPQSKVESFKVTLNEKLEAAKQLFKKKEFTGSKDALAEANGWATKILSVVDEKGQLKIGKTLPSEGNKDGQRQFEGKKILDRYANEGVDKKKQYEEAQRKLHLSADYVDKDGFLVDHQGKRVSASGNNAMYTSKLDDGTSHRFNDRTGHHSYAPGGKEVIGAGTREVKNGIVRTVTGDSGHYAPTARNIHEYVEALIAQNVKMVDDVTLFMPNPNYDPNADVRIEPLKLQQYIEASNTVQKMWHQVVSYEKELKESGRIEEYDPKIAQIKQQLADMDVWPGQKDAKVDVVGEGLLVEPSQFEEAKPKEFDPKDTNAAQQVSAKLLKLITDRFGEYVYSGAQEPRALDAEMLLNIINERRLVNKQEALTDLSAADATDLNSAVGVILRLRGDVDKEGKSKVRLTMDSQKFVQTGGNVVAAGMKQEVTDSISELEKTEPTVDVEELYYKAGGDIKIVELFKVHNSLEIPIEVKYAWLVKGRVTDDLELDKILTSRFGETYTHALSRQRGVPSHIKLILLQSDKWPDNFRQLFKPEVENRDVSEDSKEGQSSGSVVLTTQGSGSGSVRRSSSQLGSGENPASGTQPKAEGEGSESTGTRLRAGWQEGDQSGSRSRSSGSASKQSSSAFKPEIPRSTEFEKVDLRKVKVGDKLDPSTASYQDLGGDDLLLENLQTVWKQANAGALKALRELENARNVIKKQLDSRREDLEKNGISPTEFASDEQYVRLEDQLKQCDDSQREERTKWRSALDGPVPSMKMLDGIPSSDKLNMLKEKNAESLFKALKQFGK